MSWLLPFSALSERQQKAVQLDPSAHRLIGGPPGSGKTQILLHRAAFLRDAWKVPPQRLRIFVYTNVLKGYVRAGCRDLGISHEHVLTFDGWCADHHQRHLGRLPRDSERRQPDFAAIRAAVRRHVATLPGPLLDAVLVDEGQDLDQDAFQMLRVIARHVTVCADYKQCIYEHGVDEQGIAAALGLGRASLTLLEAHRCSPYLVPLAAAFIAEATEQSAFVHQCRTATGLRETPVLYRTTDAEDERDYLVEAVRARLAKGERVAVVLPQARQVHGYATALREAGLEVEVAASRGRDGGDQLDFASDRPKMLTYHGAKGLTFDSVILPRLVGSAFRQNSPADLARRLFVGVTRATRWACLITVEGQAVPALDHLDGLAAAGQLTVRQRSTATRSSDARAAPEPASEDVLDLF